MDIKKHKEYLQQGLDYYKRRLETLHDSKADTAAEIAQKELRSKLYQTICNICENSLSFIDSLMPDCEDLDEAAKKCAISKGLAQNTDGGYRYNPIFLEFFKAGALWQKEQMLQSAFTFEPKHNTACTLASECLRNHGWFQRERDFNDLWKYISTVKELFVGEFYGIEKTKIVVIKDE